jgi:hypothetical protein
MVGLGAILLAAISLPVKPFLCKAMMGFHSFVWHRGTLQLIAIHLITLHNILENLQIAII